MAWNRNYNRNYNRINLSGTPSGNDEATERQINFLLSLFNDAYGAATDPQVQGDVVTTVTPYVQDVAAVKAGHGITKRRASEIIDALKALNGRIKLVAQANATPGLAGAERVITTKRNGKCNRCGAPTVAGVDYAALFYGTWQAACVRCATTSQADRQAEIAAERQARQAQVQADAKVLRDLIAATSILRDRIVVTTGSNTRDKALRIVLPGTVVAVDNSEAAYKVSLDPNHPGVVRHTGGVGHIATHEVGNAKAFEIVNLLNNLTDADLAAAQAAYGVHFHACGRCGSPLSDDLSKARGFGPDCYGKLDI